MRAYPSAALAACLLMAVPRPSRSCQEIQHYYGSLDDSLVISGATFAGVGSPCQCCGLCHAESGCKSFSADSQANECVLYDRVGGYQQLTRLPEGQSHVQFFFMPNSSQTGEFCRSHGDCQKPGDFCRGRICTTDETVTCRDIYDMENSVQHHIYWGSINGETFLFRCWMQDWLKGYTMLLSSPHWAWWRIRNRLNHTLQSPTRDVGQQFSMLWAADIIRDSRPGDYHVIVTSYKGPERGLQYAVPRSASLLGESAATAAYQPLHGSFEFAGGGEVALPYLTDSHGVLYHTNMDTDSEEGGIMRRYHTMDNRWEASARRPGTIVLLIREGE